MREWHFAFDAMPGTVFRIQADTQETALRMLKAQIQQVLKEMTAKPNQANPCDISRRFDRRRQIEFAAARLAGQTLNHIRREVFRPKPGFMPRFLWRLIVGLVIAK